MNVNSELLEYLYQTAAMGRYTMEALVKELHNKDNKIKDFAEVVLKGYEKHMIKCEKLLKKEHVVKKDKGLMAKVMSSTAIKKEVIMDNSDSAIAEMLIQGFTMGNLEMEKKIKQYEGKADDKIIDLVKALLSFGEESIKQAKNFL